MSNGGLISGSFSSDTTLSVPVAINKGGTGQITAQAALDALAAASGTLVRGDIFTVDASLNMVRLARGSDNQTLLMNGSDVNWETVAAGGGAWEVLDATILTGALSSYTFTPGTPLTNDYQGIVVMITSELDTGDQYQTIAVNGITAGYQTSAIIVSGGSPTFWDLNLSAWRVGNASASDQGISALLTIGSDSFGTPRIHLIAAGTQSDTFTTGGAAQVTSQDEINEILIAPTAGDMKIGTTITIYGIKRS